MAWDNTVITNKGLEMLRQAIDGGELTIVSASGSDETYPAASLMVQTTPANEKQTFNITEIRDMDNGIRVRVTITNDGLTKGYVMKQMCLWARTHENDPPQIIAISQDEVGTAIPAEGEIASYLMQFYVLLKVDTATNMKIIVENSAFVTLDVVEELLKDKADLIGGKLPTSQLTIDNEPTEGSNNPISSSGAKVALDKKQNSEDAFSGDYGDLQNIPEGFTPSAHTHPYIPTSEKGQANGVAGLNKDGKVFEEQLPEMGIATETIFGGIKAKTADQINDLYEIGIDPTTGKLYSNAFTVPSLNQATPAEINLLSMNGTAKSYWSIGDLTAPITLTTGERITLQLADFNHDDLVNGGKAGITFVMKDCFKSTSYMNYPDTNTNRGGWSDSYIREKMSTYLNQFPDEWKTIIKQVKKKNVDKHDPIVITNDYLWLLSCSEINIGGDYVPNDKTAPEGEGDVYPLFTDNLSRIKNIRYAANTWWLRSPINSTSYYFVNIYDDGKPGSGYSSSSNGIVLGLCI